MRFTLETIEQEVVHPKYPEVAVTVRNLSDAEKFKYFTESSANVTPVAVENSDGSIVFDSKGNVVTVNKQNIRIDVFLELLELGVIKWRGFEDSHGKVIPYHSSNLKLLFDKRLAFEEEHSKAGQTITNENGEKILDYKGKEQTYPEKTTTQFWEHIIDVLLDDKYWDTENPTTAISG